MVQRVDVTVSGVRLACMSSGPHTGPAMVLLHALGERGETWDAVREAFDDRYRVVTIDLRGHGDSDWPGSYSFELMRDDVLGALDSLVLRDLTLVGHSMGGSVAYLVAQEQPSRISRLILEDTPPPYPREPRKPQRPDGPLDFDWDVVPAIVGQVDNPDPMWWERLAVITAPTLIIAGGPTSHVDQDKIAATADRIPDATVFTIPVGHSVHESAPAEFLAAMREFLDR